MSSNWSLERLLANLHAEIEQGLSHARGMGHNVAKGDASEKVWIELFNKYLPKRYYATRAYVVDSKGKFSDQIDIVIMDRQYSPLIFQLQGEQIVPAESVYAVFEAKQSIDAEEVAYAKAKAVSVRVLTRTSLPIPHAGGTYDAKTPGPILAGLLTFESEWSPALGSPLLKALATDDSAQQLQLGCVAAHGRFSLSDDKSSYDLTLGNKPATAFLFDLIARLQTMATVPMLDISAYAKKLIDETTA